MMKLSLTIKKVEGKKKFFKCFLKELKSKSKNKINDDQNKVSYLNKEDPLNKNQKLQTILKKF